MNHEARLGYGVFLIETGCGLVTALHAQLNEDGYGVFRAAHSAQRAAGRWGWVAALAGNDPAKPFPGVGFYYETFKWPKRFWEAVYTPVIRRAARLGVLSRQANRDRYEKACAFCDVLVIGGGPARGKVAMVAALSGLDVILADEDALFFWGGGVLMPKAKRWMVCLPVQRPRRLQQSWQVRTTVTGAVTVACLARWNMSATIPRGARKAL